MAGAVTASLWLAASPVWAEPISIAVPRATLIPRTPISHPFGAADAMQQPLRLEMYGYLEEEYSVSGTAQGCRCTTARNRWPMVAGRWVTKQDGDKLKERRTW